MFYLIIIHPGTPKISFRLCLEMSKNVPLHISITIHLKRLDVLRSLNFRGNRSVHPFPSLPSRFERLPPWGDAPEKLTSLAGNTSFKVPCSIDMLVYQSVEYPGKKLTWDLKSDDLHQVIQSLGIIK